MRPSNNIQNHAQYHISLILALIVLIGVAILVPGPAAFTATNSAAIWSAPVNLGPVINSASSDQQPAISPDGLSLYFASNRSGGLGGFDIYVSQRSSVNDPWGSIVNIGPLNTTFDEGNPAFSRDGRLLFFQSKRLPSLGGVDIWVTQRNNPHDDFDWQPAVNLGSTVNSADDDTGPCYFEDDVRGTRQLYFGSARPGLGGTDIYLSEQMADGSFGTAMLVAELSNSLNETRPSIRRNGLEIFFQSNRTGSIGTALDLWVATRGSTSDAWSTPVNLGNTVNTTFLEQNPSLSSDGMTLFFASDRSGGFGGLDLYMSTRILPKARADFDGDGKTDFSVFSPNGNAWFIIASMTNSVTVKSWGDFITDKAVPGDYDGDGKTDITVLRIDPSGMEGNWYILQSLTNTVRVEEIGRPGDIPVPADYDGDGKTDVGVWRPSTGGWITRMSSMGGAFRPQVFWGNSSVGDKPVPGDYDGDGRADIAVWRPSEGNWYIINTQTNTGSVQGWGQSGDRPVQADYDGDGRTDLAVFRPGEGNWYIRNSMTNTVTVRGWGGPSDTLVPGDYDGDGKTDIAVFRPSEGNWYVINSGNNTVTVRNWGNSNDLPLLSTYIP